MFYSPLPLSVSPEQQSLHAKEATEDMEVAILKTCQSISDLRREVSSSLSLLCPSALWVWIDVERDTDMTGMFLTRCSASVAGFHHFSASLCQLNYVIVSLLLLFFFLCLLKIHPHACLSLTFIFLLSSLHYSHLFLYYVISDSSSSSIRWQSFVPLTCSKFTGSSCLYGLSKQQVPRETWRRWRSIRASSPSRRSSW